MFSLGKGIREIIEHGGLTGVERETHFTLEREAESSLNDFKWMRGNNARDIGLNVPAELFLRQLTVPMCPGSPKASPSIPAADVLMDSYGVIVSPQTRQTFRTTPSFTGGSLTTWSEIRNGQSSPEITDGRSFAGCWNNMTFCLWGRSVELLVDAVTLALNNQIKIYATLLADVGVRYPAAFAVTVPVTAPA
jgi:hypothetical protein